MQAIFQRNDDAEISGTSLKGYCYTSPKSLVERFGVPNDCDEYKISGHYTFTNSQGHVFTLYDWKLTSLYDSEAISPEEFWKSRDCETFNIGSHDSTPKSEIESFVKFIEHG